jgi:glycosyltransferase involved in cell wall biosynthesis
MDSSQVRQHIAFLSGPAEGGMVNHMLALLGALDRRRFELCAIAPAGRLLEETAAIGLETHLLEVSARFDPRLAGRAKRLARLLDQEKADILHAHAWSAGFLASLALPLCRRRPRLVCTIHNHPPKGWWVGGVVNRVAKSADRIICVSQTLARLLPAQHQAKLRVIYNGVEIPASLPPAGEARELLGLPNQAPLVGAVARLAPQKGIGILLEAAAKLAGVHFAVIGKGPLQDALEKRRRELGLEDRFHFLGCLPETFSLLAAVDLVAIPSISEGSSIVALEALAAGKPIVASRLEPLEEIIKAGENGLLVTPHDPEALARGIERLLQDPLLAAKMREQGKPRAREFSLEQMVKATAELYDELFQVKPGKE